MIKINNQIINDPNEINNLSVETKNLLYILLKQGLVLVTVPEDFPEKESKKNKNTYKVGFIFECLDIIYPDMNKSEKYTVVSEKYHFFFTYRRFKDIYDDFQQRRNTFIQNRNLL